MMRRIRKIVFTLMLICTLFMSAIPVRVKAATTPTTVDDAYVLSRLSQLAGFLGINEGNLNEGDGVYFTVNQQKCGTGLSGHGNCDNCKNTNVANATWFKTIFGTVYVGGFPKQYRDNGVAGSHIGWSCWGFANFAMWYATSTQNTDNVIGTLVTTSTFTKENILNLLKPGYIIRCNGHSMVFISANENTMKVMDCNWRTAEDATNCRVRIREFGYNDSEFSYFKDKAMGITRAGNYEPNNSETTPPVISNVRVEDKDNTGYTVYCDVTDNEGVVKVCFPTWTEANGQDDLVQNWQETQAVYTPVSGNTYAFRVNTSEHNEEEGVYCTEIYAFDTSNNYSTSWTIVTIDKTPPVIGEAYIKDVDTTGYTVVCKATDDEGMCSVKFSTWTQTDDQDDLKIDEIMGLGDDGVYTLRVNVADHGNASGAYITKLYARDFSENGTEVILEVQVPMTEQERQVRAFVERMYTVALGRASDPSGIDYWTEQLLSHQKDGAGISEGFIMSAEFKDNNYSNEEYLKVLYRTFFNRESDEGGMSFWMSEMSAGRSRKSVLAGFVNSKEFTEICESYGINRGTMEDDATATGAGQFVERLYTIALERASDPVGLEDWAQRINSKTNTPEQVAKEFFLSPEYAGKNTSNDKYVETLYLVFMDRASEADGKAYWVGQLEQGVSRESVLEGFAQSEEFKKIMARYGL